MPFFQHKPPEEQRGCLRPDSNREPDRHEVFNFLEFLRDTGKTNMFGAVPYIEFYLDIPRNQAKEHLSAWINWDANKRKLEALLLNEPGTN